MLPLSVTKLTVVHIPTICTDCQPLTCANPCPSFSKEKKSIPFSCFQSVCQETRMGLENDPLLEDTETSMVLISFQTIPLPNFLKLIHMHLHQSTSSLKQVKWAWAELSSSWLNLGLTAAIVYLLYKILFQVFNFPSYFHKLAEQVIISINWLLFSFLNDSKTFQKEQEPPSPPEPPKPPVTMTPFIYLMYVWNCSILKCHKNSMHSSDCR